MAGVTFPSMSGALYNKVGTGASGCRQGLCVLQSLSCVCPRSSMAGAARAADDGGKRSICGCCRVFFGEKRKKILPKYFLFDKSSYICTPKTDSSGCSSARLEYTSGGRVVASSNLVIPTNRKSLTFDRMSRIFFVFRKQSLRRMENSLSFYQNDYFSNMLSFLDVFILKVL